ncbi:hypothetical protein EJB05_27954, partial [Eragrostis curvula]
HLPVGYGALGPLTARLIFVHLANPCPPDPSHRTPRRIASSLRLAGVGDSTCVLASALKELDPHKLTLADALLRPAQPPASCFPDISNPRPHFFPTRSPALSIAFSNGRKRKTEGLCTRASAAAEHLSPPNSLGDTLQGTDRFSSHDLFDDMPNRQSIHLILDNPAFMQQAIQWCHNHGVFPLAMATHNRTLTWQRGALTYLKNSVVSELDRSYRKSIHAVRFERLIIPLLSVMARANSSKDINHQAQGDEIGPEDPERNDT